MTGQILSNLFAPELALQRKIDRDIRPVAVPLVTLSGLIKPLLVPIIAALGVVLLPVLAAAKKGERTPYLKAWVFCVLTVVASFGAISLAAFHVRLLWSSLILTSACALSIILHVRNSIKIS